ncbi:hypothetical protein CPB86DRAFT_790980 [Serendipita vermifera]|nr:hypothetical protein CPB86DRAFT_790980 [Serendipita vermifera]
MSDLIANGVDYIEENVMAAVQASQIADHTNTPQDIDDEITKWELVVRTGMVYGTPEYQAGFLSSYAAALRKRWFLSHDPEDMKKVITSLENALGKIPQESAQARYDALIRLGDARQTCYQSSRTPENLSLAIQCWEDAHGLAINLRCMREAASEFLPRLADSLFFSFKNELSGVDSLQKAIDYYRAAVINAPSQQQCHLRLCFGKVYLESIEYLHDTTNLKMAIQCFEDVIQNSQNVEERLEASNEKSHCLLAELMMDKAKRVIDRRAVYPFREWTLSVARRYRGDAKAIYYYAVSALWFSEPGDDDLVWFDTAWTLFQSKCQSPPDLFHLFYAIMVDRSNISEVSSLPYLMSGLRQFILFANSATLKHAHIVQSIEIYPEWTASRQNWPGNLEGDHWTYWKHQTIHKLLGIYHRITRRAVEVYNKGLKSRPTYDHESDPVQFSGKSHADIEAELEARIVKPTNPV